MRESICLDRLRAEVEALKALLRSRDDELFAREKEVEALRSNYYRLCLWAIDRRPDLPDHSCVECVPNSDLIIRDYRCAYHTAKTWAALAAAGRRERNE